MSTRHVPVLLQEVVEVFQPLKGKVIVDGTLGGGGHTAELLAGGAKVIGFDRDGTALARVAPHPDLTKVHGNFRNLDKRLDELGVDAVDGVLLDLGYSSDQMDDPRRGLAYGAEGPLDMRLNPGQKLTAAEIINHWPEAELARIFWEYGEESKSRVIARKLAAGRKGDPIETTGQLLKVIEEVYPARPGLARSHPAARVFQALRIAVNDELGDLEAVIPQAAGRLSVGGKLAVITFNSLEDRLVKEAFKALAADRLDSVGRVAGEAPFKAWKKIAPGEAEVAGNRRARSAKVRVLARV
jgi:16S rRNA (cytosine1402-N4)-methyltransferase